MHYSNAMYKNTSMDDKLLSTTSTSNRFGIGLAAAAVLVQAPRLVLTILAADRLPVAEQAEQILLSVAALGTAVAVTGGGVYIAHAALTAPRWRLALGTAWLLVLTASAGLVSPDIAARLAGLQLYEVVNTPALRAAWAVLAALAHEFTAAGCMLAAAATSRALNAAERDDTRQRLALAEQRAERAEKAERELSEIWEGDLEISDDHVAEAYLPADPEPFPCQWCARPFKTKQARGGHQRSCPARPGVQSH